MKIPVTAIIVTKNEEVNIRRCLDALDDFAQILVVDSSSDDRTCTIAKSCGVQVINFVWNGAYPKKRQWCLDHIETAYDWILFIDADEVMTMPLVAAIKDIFSKNMDDYAGFFIEGRYIWQEHELKRGLTNNKIALMHKKRMGFPVINDLDIEGMGEIEGHYQPVMTDGNGNYKIGQLVGYVEHYIEDYQSWLSRHERYARWEAGMNDRGSWPQDPRFLRQCFKQLFRRLPFRHIVAFLHSYIFKMGFLDGKAGYDFAKSRALYYKMI